MSEVNGYMDGDQESDEWSLNMPLTLDVREEQNTFFTG